MTSTVFASLEVDPPKSKIRRKPTTTYKSPSANDIDPPITPSIRNNIPSTSVGLLSDKSNPPQNAQKHPQTYQRSPRARNYILPLYHPLGELALSLPPLNPADFGLPLPRLPDETNRKLTADSHNPTIPFDADEDVSVPSVSSIAAVAANEVKRVGPRRRRMGAGGGKRRRRDLEDGDATYPAKRTRQARGVGGDEIDFDEGHIGDADGALEVDGPAERRPERRSTRSRTKRRDSDEIESPDEQPVQDSLLIPGENPRQMIPEEMSEGVKEVKEEGEINGDR